MNLTYENYYDSSTAHLCDGIMGLGSREGCLACGVEATGGRRHMNARRLTWIGAKHMWEQWD